MTGYTRADTANNIANGNIIDAADLDGEFDAVQSAFNAGTGHKHDGTAGEGAPITQIGPAQDVVASGTELRPKTTNVLDLGTNLLRYKDLYLSGSANITTSVITPALLSSASTLALTAGGANAITFTTNSNERVRIDASGNVGLGVTPSAWSASSAMQFANQYAVGSQGFSRNVYFDGTNSRYITTAHASTYQQSVGQHYWYTAPSGTAGNPITFTQAMTLDASGNLGLGTSSPIGFGAGYTSLHVSGSNTGIIRLSDTGQTSNLDLFAGASLPTVRAGAGSPLVLASNATEAMRIDASGNVGIGQTSPATRLDVKGPANGSHATFSNVAGRGLLIATAITAGTHDAVSILDARGAASGTMVFRTDGTERMRIDSAGNVGIGTASPGTALETNGRITIKSSGDANLALVLNNTAGGGREWQLIGSSTGGLDGGGTFNIRDNTAGANRLTLDASGNLGLGVTPAAWGAGFRVAQIGAATSVGTESSVASVFANNAIYDSSWKYLGSGRGATNYSPNDGQHRWLTAPSGTAGNAITFTQAMTLTSNSELNIDGGAGSGRLTFTPSGTVNTISATTTGFSAYNSLRLRGSQLEFYTDASSPTERARITTDGDFGLARSDAAGPMVYSSANVPLRFGSNGVERARIHASGGVSIGNTTDPGATNLSVTGSVTGGAGSFTTLTASSTATLNTLSSSGATITGGTINGTSVGATTASTGRFTTLTTTGAATPASLSTSSATITGGTINSTSVGATTPSTGAFTTLTASSTATLNTLSSSGATLTGGSINNMAIGATTRAAGNFTALDFNNGLNRAGTAAYTFRSFTTLTTGAGAIYNAPTGCRMIKVTCVGGGGGGGSVDGQGAGSAQAAGGGGGGAVVIKYVFNPSGNYTYTIGGAGAGGLAQVGAQNGATGGTTTFSGTGATLSAPGGVGGELDAGGGTGGYGTQSGGAGGSAASGGGDVNIDGQPGFRSSRLSGSSQILAFGQGASGPFGAAAQFGSLSQAGENATGYGAGGNGARARDVATNFAGGSGSGGVIFIEEYF